MSRAAFLQGAYESMGYPRQTARFKASKAGQRRRRRRNFQSVPRTRGALAQTENKYFDCYSPAAAVSEATTWAGAELDGYISSGGADTAISCLFAPTEGSDIDNRIGRKVQVTRIDIRGVIQPSVEADQADVLRAPPVRLVLYVDTQTNGAQSQAEQLFDYNAFTASTQMAFTAHQNPANFGRFRVLKDKIYRPPTVTAATDGASTCSVTHASMPFKLRYTFKTPMIVKFNSTNGGTIADIVDNSFHLVGHKSSTEFTHNIFYNCRVYYKDL